MQIINKNLFIDQHADTRIYTNKEVYHYAPLLQEACSELKLYIDGDGKNDYADVVKLLVNMMGWRDNERYITKM